MGMHVPLEAPKGVKGPGTKVTNNYKLLCGFLEVNLGSLQEPQVPLTPESSLLSQ